MCHIQTIIQKTLFSKKNKNASSVTRYLPLTRHIAVLAFGHTPAVMSLGVDRQTIQLLAHNVLVSYTFTTTLDPQVGFRIQILTLGNIRKLKVVHT